MDEDFRPKIQLDYSSPAHEKKREDGQEKERQEKLENYNLTTFGESHPYLYPFARRFAIYAILILMAIFLPRWWQIRLTAGRFGWRWPFGNANSIRN